MWQKLGHLAITLFLATFAWFVVVCGIQGRPFILRGRGRSGPYEIAADLDYNSAVDGGRTPFSADSLIFYQLGFTLVAVILALYAPMFGRWLGRVGLVVTGLAFITALVSLVLEIIWVSTGVPYSNYLRDTSEWRYSWPIAALVVWLALWGAAFLVIWRPDRFGELVYRLGRKHRARRRTPNTR